MDKLLSTRQCNWFPKTVLICWIVIYLVDSAIKLLNNEGQAHIVQKLDCAIHLTEISPVDSTIDLLNNWGQESKYRILVLKKIVNN